MKYRRGGMSLQEIEHAMRKAHAEEVAKEAASIIGTLVLFVLAIGSVFAIL